MSDNLERVGLIFKANGTVDFVASLQNVNAKLSENYNQFKKVQTLWDDSTKTSQKLADRMAYLNKAYDLQKDKVGTLQVELGELENSEKKNEVAISKKRAELSKAEASLEKYGKQIDVTSKKIKNGTADLEDMGKKFDEAGEAMKSTGKKASVFTAAYTAAMGLAINSSIKFESSFAGVEKTVDGTTEQMAELKQGIRDLALVIPASTDEINGVAEAAGQLGIRTEEVLGFTEVMINMGEATSMSSNEAATTLARFANVTKMSQSDFGRLGSTIVALGNNFATTETEIASMAMNLGSAGSQVGMTQAEIAAFATALSSVGIEAQAGGTAFSKVMIEMQLATETQSDKLKDFAAVAGMTSQEFTKAFKEDATGAIMAFVEGLSKSGEQGKSAIAVLDDMGIKETRLRDALLRSANASDLFSSAIGVGNQAWEENIALTEEAEKRYATTESQMAIIRNTMNDIGITFGDIVIPVWREFLEVVKDVLNQIREMDPEFQRAIVIIGALIAIIGPLLIFFGKISSAIGSMISLFVKLKPVVLPIFTAIKAAVVGLAAALGLPVAAVVAIGAAIAALVFLVIKYWDEIVSFTLKMVEDIKTSFESFSVYLNEIISSIKEWFTNVFESMKTTILSVFESVKVYILSVFENIKEIVTNAVNNIVATLSTPFEYVKNALLLMVALFAIALETIYVNVIQPLVEYFSKAIEDIKVFITNGLESIKATFSSIFAWINEKVIQPTVIFFKTSFETIKTVIKDSLEFAKNMFRDAFAWIKETVVNPLIAFFSNTFNSILGVIDKVIASIRGAFTSVGEFIKGIFESVKTTVTKIFGTVGEIIKTPINGIISLINNVLSSLNKIKVPSWVPGIGGSGINFPMVKFLAKGGDLLSGQAIVAEAGPELLQQDGNKTRVTPLSSGGGAVKHDLIDYYELAKVLTAAMRAMKFTLGEDGFGKFIDERMLEYV